MYGLGLSVANVTANGEEIVSVNEGGLSNICTYIYNNGKSVDVYIDKGRVIKIIVDIPHAGAFGLSKDFNYEELSSKQKESWFNNNEKQMVIEDAIRRYRSDHKIHSGSCKFL